MTNDIYKNLDIIKKLIIQNIKSLNTRFVDSRVQITCSSDELDFFLRTLLPGVFTSVLSRMDLYMPSEAALNQYLAQRESELVLISHNDSIDVDNYNLIINTCINTANNLKGDFDRIANVK